MRYCVHSAFCIAFVALCAANAAPIPPDQLTVPRAYTNAAGQVLLYRWAEPAKPKRGEKYPLVLLFHGAGEWGNNNKAQLSHGARDILNYMRDKGIEGYFLAAQCPANKMWVDGPWESYAHRLPEKPSETMGLVIEFVEKLLKDKQVDPDRILATGVSMGGYGTWDIVQRRPEWFAAAIPCCGGGDTTLAWTIRDVAIWVFHGEKDDTVPVSRSRDMVSALWAVKGNVRYTEYPGVGHVCWHPAYADHDNVLKWFFEQRRVRQEAGKASR